MSYSITIGEKIKEGKYITAKGEHHNFAPAFGEPTDHTNSRWPAYTGWDNFLNFVGPELKQLVMGQLMPKHPGWVKIKPSHYTEFTAIFDEFKKKHPTATPSFDTDKEADGAIARMVWLDYWLNWALNNCECPIFYNS